MMSWILLLLVRHLRLLKGRGGQGQGVVKLAHGLILIGLMLQALEL